MKLKRKKTARRIIVLLLCLALATAFILSSLTCAKLVLHRCCGGDCRICDLLINTVRTLKQLALAVLLAGIAAMAGSLPPLCGCSFCAKSKRGATLVRLKIKLNN
jgi:hypothetical protein